MPFKQLNTNPFNYKWPSITGMNKYIRHKTLTTRCLLKLDVALTEPEMLFPQCLQSASWLPTLPGVRMGTEKLVITRDILRF